MKKILFSLLALFIFNVNINAQDVYNAIRSKALLSASDPSGNPMLKKFNQFKVDALDYMAIKMKEQMPDSTATFLDKQAFAMNNFINLYMQNIVDTQNQPANYQIYIIKIFMDASYSNPLFNDPDKELVLSYYSDGNSLTRFSLDTDWRRAIIAASMQLKKLQ
jgi:hypothetical protein